MGVWMQLSVAATAVPSEPAGEGRARQLRPGRSGQDAIARWRCVRRLHPHPALQGHLRPRRNRHHVRLVAVAIPPKSHRHAAMTAQTDGSTKYRVKFRNTLGPNPNEWAHRDFSKHAAAKQFAQRKMFDPGWKVAGWPTKVTP